MNEKNISKHLTPQDLNLECPITLEIFKEPVIAADGKTYERQAIQSWLVHSNRSPCTNQETLNNKNLTTDFKTLHAVKLYQYSLQPKKAIPKEQLSKSASNYLAFRNSTSSVNFNFRILEEVTTTRNYPGYYVIAYDSHPVDKTKTEETQNIEIVTSNTLTEDALKFSKMRNLIAKLKDHKPYYHPVKSTIEAEEYLRGKPPKTFIIRPSISQPGKLAVSRVDYKGEIKHHVFVFNKAERIHTSKGDFTIHSFIDYFKSVLDKDKHSKTETAKEKNTNDENMKQDLSLLNAIKLFPY